MFMQKCLPSKICITNLHRRVLIKCRLMIWRCKHSANELYNASSYLYIYIGIHIYGYSNERSFKERCYVFLKSIRVLPFFTGSIIEKTIKEIISVYFQAAHHTEQPTDHDPEVFHLLKIRYPETFARVSRSLLVFSYVWSLVRRRIIMLEPILGTLSIWWLVVYANILLLLSPLVLLMIVFLPNFPILLLRRICYIPIESIWNQSISHRIIAASHL